MAIYRSDQAQFSFAAETYDGGMLEQTSFTAVGTNTDTTLTVGAVKAGDRSINVLAVAPFEGFAENYVSIQNGVGEGTADVEAKGPAEVRRVIGISGTTLHLDVPLGFDHDSNATAAKVLASGGGNLSMSAPPDEQMATAGSRKYITWIPGVYETVDAPDLEESFDARYMLADNSRRNPWMLMKGTQSFEGSVAGIVLLNGWPLRFALGGIDSYEVNSAGAIAGDAISGNPKIIGSKGDIFVGVSASAAIVDTTVLMLNPAASGTASSRWSGTGESTEIVKVIAGGGSSLTTSSILELNQPLKFDHTTSDTAAKVVNMSATTDRIHHNIFASTQLPSMTWNINVRDEAGTNAFQRRYYGGKVGGMTLTAEEGGLVICDWDSVQFLGMVHNQYASPRDGDTSAASDTPYGLGLRRYHPMQEIEKSDLGPPNITTTGTHNLPSTQPYYFSEGTLKFFGTEVARLRSFSLSINNQLEPRYYVRNAYNDNRGPFEIKEGERSYSLTATVGLPDSETNQNNTHNLFKELMTTGHYTEAVSNANNKGMVGFNVELLFTRGNDATDFIRIRIPESYDGTESNDTASAQEGGPNKQGAFIMSAPTNIDGNNPMEMNVNIMFSNMKLEVSDKEMYYP